MATPEDSVPEILSMGIIKPEEESRREIDSISGLSLPKAYYEQLMMHE